MRVRTRISAGLLAGAALLMLTGCGGDDSTSSTTDDSSAQAAAAEPTTSTTATASATDEVESTEADLEDFCSRFPELGGSGGETQAYTAEQWEVRVENVQGIAAAAPDEIKAQAEAYAVMMQARADLAAENGYVAATELDPAVRQEFIAELGGLQTQVNELIAYAREECDLG